MLPEDTRETISEIHKQTNELLQKLPGTGKGDLILPGQKNVTKDEITALNNLKNNHSIVVKKADKGGAIVVLDRECYIREAERQLSNPKYYCKINEPIYLHNIDKINSILRRLHEGKHISGKQLQYLLADKESSRPRIFYLLPKIHKNKDSWPQPGRMPEGRPVVSDCSSESYRVCEYIDSFLSPLSILHPAYLKDTYDFIDKVRDRSVPEDCLLVTADISSLYTNINLDRVLEIVRQNFIKYPDESRPVKEILELLEITLKNNDFEFNGQFYLQIHGTPMGKLYSPSLANLYLQYFDHMAMNGFRVKPAYYGRYLDDLFIIWVGSVEDLKEYNIFLNGLIPDIKLTFNYDSNSVDYLDTTIYKVRADGSTTLKSKVFFKETDAHQLLHTESFHPKHTTRGILKSQLLRFKRISSTFEDYAESCKILFEALLGRGYSSSRLRKMKREIWRNPYTPKDKSKTQDNNLLPIVLRYNQFGNKVINLWKNIIRGNDYFKDCRLVSAYSKNKSIADHLIRSKLHRTGTETGSLTHNFTSTEGPPGFFTCGSKRCMTCTHHASSSKSFTSTTTGQTFLVSGNVNCGSRNIIYLVTCNKCKLQYVGETGRELRQRVVDHRSAIRTHKNTPVGVHFNEIGHSMLDFSVTAIEKLTDNTPLARKQREEFWQRRLYTKFPHGINCLL